MVRPETSHDSKRVMARAEHEDTIRVDTLGECIVVQRYQTYFGPKLRIEPDDEDTQYLLTAPSPKSELNLWENVGGEWDVQAEVSAELMEMKQYEICQYCGEPLKTADHRRRRAVGACGT